MAVQHDKWEYFRDAAYYDMYCVRQVGERVFGQGFHLVSQDEAKDLCDLLNHRTQDSEARALLEHCAEWFEEYAESHFKKAREAVDSYEAASRKDKAVRNAERAATIRAYLTRTAPNQ